MANGTLDQLVGGNFERDKVSIQELVPILKELVAGIRDVNAVAKASEGLMSQATNIKQVADAEKMLVDAQGRLIDSTGKANKLLEEAAAVKARWNGSTKDVLQTSEKLIRLTKEEAAAQQANNKAMREAEAIRTQAAKTATEQAKASTEASKASLNEAKAATEAAKQKKFEQEYTQRLTKEIERLEAARDRETKKLEQQSTAYGQLKTRYKEAADQAKELGSQYVLLEEELERLQKQAAAGAGAPGLNLAGQISAKAGELNKLSVAVNAANADALKLQKSLLGVEQAVGQSQRNVGNYVGAILSLQQVLREAPAFANSFQTGLSAIGNNLPTLVDEFTRVKTATGSTSAALKVFGGALFSLNGILPLVFLGVQLLTSAMAKSSKESGDAGKALAALNAEQKAAAELSKKIGDNYGRESTALEILKAKIEDVNVPMKVRLDGVKDIQEQFPTLFENYSKEAILIGKVGDAYAKANEAIMARARLSAVGDSVGANASRLNQLEDRIRKVQRERPGLDIQKAGANALVPGSYSYGDLVTLLGDNPGYQTGEKDSEGQPMWSDLVTDINEYNTLLLQNINLLKQIKELTPAAAVDVKNPKKDPKGKAPADYTNEELKAETDLTKELFEQLKRRAQIEADNQQFIGENERNALADRIAAYRAYINARLQVAGYEYAQEVTVTQQKLDKIAEIEKIPAEKRTKEQKGLLRERKILTAQLENIELGHVQNVNRIVNEGNAAILDAQDKADKDRIAKAEKTARELARLSEGVGSEEAFDRQQRKDDKEKARQDKQLRETTQFAQNIAQLNTNITNRRVQEIDQEIAAINKKRDAEISAINLVGGSEEEKQRKILEAQAKADAQTQVLENQKKQRLRRAAELEKAVTISQIIAETALATVRALGSKPYTPANLALAAATAAMGAAQLAVAISAPLPQYAQGTDDHPGGDAIIAEGNRRELVRERDGRWWMAEKEGVYKPGKHAQVFPHVQTEQMMKIAGMFTMGLPALIPQNNAQQVDMTGVMSKLDAVADAVKASPKTAVKITGKGIEHLVDTGGGRARYVRND